MCKSVMKIKENPPKLPTQIICLNFYKLQFNSSHTFREAISFFSMFHFHAKCKSSALRRNPYMATLKALSTWKDFSHFHNYKNKIDCNSFPTDLTDKILLVLHPTQHLGSLLCINMWTKFFMFYLQIVQVKKSLNYAQMSWHFSYKNWLKNRKTFQQHAAATSTVIARCNII